MAETPIGRNYTGALTTRLELALGDRISSRLMSMARPWLDFLRDRLVHASDRRRAAKGVEMSGKADKAKGRVKEAIGALTGDRKLKREGKIDQAAGDAKDAAEKTIERVKNSLTH